MSDIVKTILNKLDSDTIKKISSTLGEDSAKTQQAVEKALHTIVGGLSKKMESGTKSLGKLTAIIDRDGDGDVDLDDIMSFMEAKKSGDLDLKDMASELFGEKKQAVTDNISAETGISQSSSNELLDKLTPMVMEHVNKAKQDGKLDLQGLASLVKNQLGNADSLKGMLDDDGDGKTDIGDVISVGKKLFGRFRNRK